MQPDSTTQDALPPRYGRMRRHLCLASLLFLGCAEAALASSTWPGLRGPDYDGSARDGQLNDGEELALGLAWKQGLGSGYSSVVVGDGRVITMFSAGDADVMAAFSTESGDELWRYRIGDIYKGHDGSHDGPIATPVLAGDKVVGFGAWGHLFALEAATGREIWAQNLVETQEAKKPHYGFSSSPVVAGDLVIAQIGAGEGKSIAGFSLADGSLAWSTGDDEIHYHSPVLAEIGGQRQVLAAGSKTLMGLDPASGKVLWSHEHGGDERAMGAATIIPLPAGDGRIFLMHKIDASVMLQVEKKGDAYEISELWSNNVIRSSYVHPVVHEGYLYGMSGRIFTCVDIATGERQWRSREPGDGFPTLVGDRLVIITKPGTLHVVKASPEAYEEITRLQLFDEHSWSNVAFAGGHLYARSMGHLARVDAAGAAASDGEAGGWLASTDFGRFLNELEGAADKNAAIEAYLAKQSSFPIIEPGGAVHFLYRGDAEDVGIVGDMIGFRREDPMTRVAGTDLFYYSTRLEADAAVSYGFIPSYEQAIADPLNPRAGQGLFGEVSWFSMPAFRPAAYEGAEPASKGRLEVVEWTSEAREGQERKATVYLPATYDADAERRFPTIYIHDGKSALEDGKLTDALDHFLGAGVEPVVAVFVMPPEENPRGDSRDGEAYGKMIAEELVPLVDSKFRTVADRASRASAGTADGGTTAMVTAFSYPQLFSKVAAHAPVFMDAQQIAAALPSAEEHLFQIYQTWGVYHLRSPHEAWDMAEANRQFWSLLRERGYRPSGGENSGGFGWETWRSQVGDWLVSIFPAGS